MNKIKLWFKRLFRQKPITITCVHCNENYTIYNSVYDLTLWPISASGKAWVRGCYTPGDGGGGWYTWSEIGDLEDSKDGIIMVLPTTKEEK